MLWNYEKGQMIECLIWSQSIGEAVIYLFETCLDELENRYGMAIRENYVNERRMKCYHVTSIIFRTIMQHHKVVDCHGRENEDNGVHKMLHNSRDSTDDDHPRGYRNAQQLEMCTDQGHCGDVHVHCGVDFRYASDREVDQQAEDQHGV